MHYMSDKRMLFTKSLAGLMFISDTV